MWVLVRFDLGWFDSMGFRDCGCFGLWLLVGHDAVIRFGCFDLWGWVVWFAFVGVVLWYNGLLLDDGLLIYVAV